MRKVILITGISSGFGRQTSRMLAEKGHAVYGTVRKSEKVDGTVSLLTMDLTDIDSIRRTVREVVEMEGRIDVLINNAGMHTGGAIETTPAENIRLQMETSFMGMVNLTREVLPVMRHNGGGTIINISSIGGLMGLPFQAFYSAAKFAVEGFSEALRMETRSFNIKVVVINPGDFHTNNSTNRRGYLTPTGPDDPYHEQFEKTLTVIENDEAGGRDPSVFASRLVRIVECRNPRNRYIIASTDQKLAVFLKKILPEKISESILASHYGIRRQKWRRRNMALILIFTLLFSLQGRSQVPAVETDSAKLEAVHLFSEYLKLASVTGNEKVAGEFIVSQCLERGLYVTTFTDSIDCYNFAASLYPLELRKPNIILLSHLDVVSGGEYSGWKYPAFSGAVVDDTIWGRGAIDMKEATIMHLLAASAFAERASTEELPFNVTLVCVSGEETFGVRGSKIVSEIYWPELNAIIVFGEGGIGTTGLLSKTPEKPVFFISLNEKRALWLELNLNFKTSGHGAVPPPDYATSIMINSLSNLTKANPKIRFNHDNKTMLSAYGDLEKGLTGFLLKNPVLFKPLVASGLRKNPMILSTVTNTITITHIASEETDINQIPQKVTAFLDCRLLPETSTSGFIDFIHNRLNHSQIGISIIQETQNAITTVPDRYYELFVEALNETYPGCGIIPVLFPATTDNNYFRNKGLPVFGIIPVILDQKLLETIHNYNERLPVDALISGTEVYTRFIEKLLPVTVQETDSLIVSEH